MCSLRKILSCTLWNLRLLSKNLRFYLGLGLGFLICFFLTEKTVSLAHLFGTNIQVVEPFVWCFADSDSVLFASLALLLPLSQIPRLDAPASYLVFRAGRRNWILGQAVTTILVSIFYTVFLLISTCLLTLGRVSLSNEWSDTATVMSFAPAQFEVALTVVRRTIKQTTPYACAGSIFLLMAQYMLLLSLLNLAVSLRFGKRAGMNVVIAVSLLSYLLTPERFMVWLGIEQEGLRYIANLCAAWLSPLQQATYTMHSFGYDQLPTITQTHLLMGPANVGLLILCIAAGKRIHFLFRKGEANE